MRLFTNNAKSHTISTTSSSQTQIFVPTEDLPLFASPALGEWQDLTITQDDALEIVRLVGKTSASLVVERGMYGTTALLFASGATVSARFTAQAASDLEQRQFATPVEVVAASSSVSDYENNDVVRVTTAAEHLVGLDVVSDAAFKIGSSLSFFQKGAGKVTVDNATANALGEVWVPRTSGAGVSWVRSVAHKSGAFVATAARSFLRSTDQGVTWSIAQTSSGVEGDLFSVSEINSALYANAQFGYIFRSTDNGATWTPFSVNTAGNTVYHHLYGNSAHVVLSFGFISYSANAETWTQATHGLGSREFNGYFGGGLFVAGTDIGQIITSPDGQTWTSRTSNFGGDYIGGGLYANSLHVMWGDAGRVVTSPDGVTWTARTSQLGANYIQGGIYANGLFVLVAGAGALATSPDGETWTARTSQFGASGINGIRYFDGAFWIFGVGGKLAKSVDGVTWTLVTSGFDTTDVLSMAFDGTNAMVLTGKSGKISSSSATDGVTVNTPETKSTKKQFSRMSLTKVAEREWDLSGDLEAAP